MICFKFFKKICNKIKNINLLNDRERTSSNITSPVHIVNALPLVFQPQNQSKQQVANDLSILTNNPTWSLKTINSNNFYLEQLKYGNFSWQNKANSWAFYNQFRLKNIEFIRQKQFIGNSLIENMVSSQAELAHNLPYSFNTLMLKHFIAEPWHFSILAHPYTIVDWSKYNTIKHQVIDKKYTAIDVHQIFNIFFQKSINFYDFTSFSFIFSEKFNLQLTKQLQKVINFVDIPTSITQNNKFPLNAIETISRFVSSTKNMDAITLDFKYFLVNESFLSTLLNITFFFCPYLIIILFGFFSPFFNAFSYTINKNYSFTFLWWYNNIIIKMIIILLMYTIPILSIQNLILTKMSGCLQISLLEWLKIPGIDIQFNLWFDTLSLLMIIMVSFVAGCVIWFAASYMEHDRGVVKFIFCLVLFTFIMFGLLTASNLIQFFFAWESLGLCSFILITFWNDRSRANQSAVKAVLVNKIGDCGLLLSIVLIYSMYRSVNFSTINSLAFSIGNETLSFLGFNITKNSLICFGLTIAAFCKSAQIGFHIWLPDAMEGPTPVSALIHAATMVTAGIYLVFRCSVFFVLEPQYYDYFLFFGGLTTIFGASTALAQFDIKKIIAYSTCSQLGYLFIACGLCRFDMAIFHLINHAFFKAALFLSAGILISVCNGEQDIRKMGGLRYKFPDIFSIMLISSLSLCGFPFLSGYYSKEPIIAAALADGSFMGNFAYSCSIISAFITSLYSARLLYYVFFGRLRGSYKFHITKIKYSFTKHIFPIVFLVILSIIFGFYTQDIFIGTGNYMVNSLFYTPIHKLCNNDYEFVQTQFFTLLSLISSVFGFIFYFIRVNTNKKLISKIIKQIFIFIVKILIKWNINLKLLIKYFLYFWEYHVWDYKKGYYALYKFSKIIIYILLFSCIFFSLYIYYLSNVTDIRKLMFNEEFYTIFFNYDCIKEIVHKKDSLDYLLAVSYFRSLSFLFTICFIYIIFYKFFIKFDNYYKNIKLIFPFSIIFFVIAILISIIGAGGIIPYLQTLRFSFIILYYIVKLSLFIITDSKLNLFNEFIDYYKNLSELEKEYGSGEEFLYF